MPEKTAAAETLAVSVGAPDNGPKGIPDTASAPEPELPLGYSLTDTADWGTEVEMGERAVLRRAGVIIDTVDLAFGVVPLGEDSLVFLPVRTDTESSVSDSTGTYYHDSPTQHVLWTPSGRRELRDLIPFFEASRSSPQITSESVIHYWGVGSPGPAYRVYAMRYDIRTARLDSLFIGVDGMESDYRYYLPTPRVTDTEVLFHGHRLDRTTWRAIPQSPPSN